MVDALPFSPSATGLRPLSLRLRIPGEADRLVTVADRLLTIGSDPSCTVRVSRLGPQPFLGLIIHGAERTLLRAAVGETAEEYGALQRRPPQPVWRETLLTPGEHAALGPLDVEVLRPEPAECAAAERPAAGTAAEGG